ncbi:unnamed protein product [Rotaria magnacalcarata]|uniref:Uncharacterized protein n=2 Tax=Rotaria magnacalcarata TaxID=392030 RepID=A0A816C7Y0_9BILA|nr:unnamed protein product [Rotaria magnacalcarata]CAF2060610.1 unnamed protein product [Rotaria magnacalcarata]CAF2111599.1 unnamed protein product [Rotaria magnacalcarata]CAF2129118.1 unnamed protein product [Rotaria magnacalcarata]CAF3795652.1 unnamed protein product [Rotaria magnacalcarata]
MSSMSSHSKDIINDDGDYYTDVNGYQVPQNIRHRFRSKITTELLADKNKVEHDKHTLESINAKQPTPIYRRSQTTLTRSNSDYAKISNDLRYTVAHGNPVERQSHSKTVHNQELFKNLQDDNKFNPNRRRKDWLARWTEANIVRDRLYKSILEAQKKPTQ